MCVSDRSNTQLQAACSPTNTNTLYRAAASSAKGQLVQLQQEEKEYLTAGTSENTYMHSSTDPNNLKLRLRCRQVNIILLPASEYGLNLVKCSKRWHVTWLAAF